MTARHNGLTGKWIAHRVHEDTPIDRPRPLLYFLTSILADSALVGSAAASPSIKDTSATPMQAKDASKASSEKPSTKTQTAASSRASASEIANAKAKGLAWVNTESKVYHSGGRYCGKAKHGQFMSKADAQKAGHKAAKR